MNEYTEAKGQDAAAPGHLDAGRYEFIVNAVPDGMSVINRDGRYEAVNDSWCAMMGLRREQAIGRKPEDIWGRERYLEFIAPRLESVFATAAPLTQQARLLLPSGETRDCSISYYPSVGADGAVDYAVVVTRDVSELERARRELQMAKEVAESASRAKSEFLASMSHELRTPLNSILGFSQLLAADESLPAPAREEAREIERAGDHLLALVNDLIDLARIEAGKLELSLEPVSVRAVVADSLAITAPLAQRHGIAFVENMAADEQKRLAVRADHVRLRQVLINLLSNAIKYNRPQGSVRISLAPAGERLRLIVADTGVGIAPDKQASLFNAFDRLGREGGSVEGTGIGLVITKRIAEAMGGQIGFSSVLGQGSNFWVEFPLCEEPEIQPAGAAVGVPATGLAPSADLARHRVLYVEDNALNQRLMERIVAKRQDLSLRCASTAEEGIEVARAERPDLILMDINLPGMDGYAALAQLRADAGTSQIPVVAVTANAMKGDLERGRHAGFDAYLTKPLDLRELQRVFDSLLIRAAGRP